jgi:phage tail sheath protein FI
MPIIRRSRVQIFRCVMGVMAWILAMTAMPLQAGSFGPIEDHYYGATLFIAATGNTVWPPVAVTSLEAYITTYGPVDGPDTDYGLEAARLFFANGGSELFVIDPQGTKFTDFGEALAASEGLPVDLVAMPGTACCQSPALLHASLMNLLLNHVDASPNRFAVISAPRDSNANELIDFRSQLLSSDHGALYAPWLTVSDADAGTLATVSPVGAVAGVISRIDREFALFKSPAGSDAMLFDPPHTSLDRDLAADQDDLNSQEINVLREFGDPSALYVWGARSLSDNLQRRFISVTRFLRHLQFSMTRSLAWIGETAPGDFNPTIVELLIDDYLYNYWLEGAFAGVTTDEGYFISCASEPPHFSCVVGVAMLMPAEFEIFQLRIPYRDEIFHSRFALLDSP